MKIKVINPNTTLEMTEGIGEAARSVAGAGTEIVAVSPEFGPESIESYYDEQVAACGVLDEVRKGEAEGVDAYVIACYGDPGLHAAREVTEKPVVGIAEASFYTASMVAARFTHRLGHSTRAHPAGRDGTRLRHGGAHRCHPHVAALRAGHRARPGGLDGKAPGRGAPLGGGG